MTLRTKCRVCSPRPRPRSEVHTNVRLLRFPTLTNTHFAIPSQIFVLRSPSEHHTHSGSEHDTKQKHSHSLLNCASPSEACVRLAQARRDVKYLDVVPGCRRGRGLELENMRGFYSGYASSLLLLLPLCNGQEVRTTSVSISSLSPSST